MTENFADQDDFFLYNKQNSVDSYSPNSLGGTQERTFKSNSFVYSPNDDDSSENASPKNEGKNSTRKFSHISSTSQIVTGMRQRSLSDSSASSHHNDDLSRGVTNKNMAETGNGAYMRNVNYNFEGKNAGKFKFITRLPFIGGMLLLFGCVGYVYLLTSGSGSSIDAYNTNDFYSDYNSSAYSLSGTSTSTNSSKLLPNLATTLSCCASVLRSCAELLGSGESTSENDMRVDLNANAIPSADDDGPTGLQFKDVEFSGGLDGLKIVESMQAKMEALERKVQMLEAEKHMKTGDVSVEADKVGAKAGDNLEDVHV